MTTDTTGVDRALGAIGTTFRLTRLYPPTHPAVQEALRQVGEAIPPLAAVGTVEWKVGATGLHWHGQQLLPRNSQSAELAGLLYARGVRTLTLNPGMTADHVLALFQVATGTAAPDAQTLGRITITLGRRSAARLERTRPPTPAEGVLAIADPASGGVPAAAAPAPETRAAAAADTLMSAKRPSAAFRPDALPPDVEAARAVAAVRAATAPDEQRAAVEKLAAVAPQLLGLREVAPSADAIAALDHLLPEARDPALLAAIDAAALALSDRALVERVVRRLGEAGGREIARPAMPALKDESVAVRAAAARTIAAAGDPASSTVLIRRVEQEPDEGVQAELLRAIGRLGAKEALDVLARFAEPGGMMHRRSTTVRAAAVEGLRHIARPEGWGLLEPYSKDKEPAVRNAAEAAPKSRQ